MKVIIFDASTLISFSMSGLFSEIRKLKKIFNGKFIITKDVEKEVVDVPLKIRRFELEAIRVRHLMNEKIIERPESLNITEKEISQKTNEFIHKANALFSSKGKAIEIIHSGEASCLALSRLLKEKGMENVIAMDERTTRVLVERPKNLASLLEHRLHTRINSTGKDFEVFKGFKIIRSTELIYISYKKGLIDFKGKGILEALLFALKHKGSAITGQEIKSIVKAKA